MSENDMGNVANDKKTTAAIFAKTAFFALAAVYFLARAADRNGYGFFDNVDLVFHEAGHVIFSLFGEIVGVAGGTIMQLLVPLALAVYFFAKKDRYSAGLVILWLGQSSVNAARYAADAVELKLPLLGDGMHDWTYMLSLTNSLGQAAAVSDIFYYSGIAIIMAGIIIGILSFRSVTP
jgi:hypothetical protein